MAAYPLLVITGPTGCGKTAVAVQLAEVLNGEIISADSMQVYRHLSIGTAKPFPEELRGCSYHLVDHIEPHNQYNLGRFVQEASQWIEVISEKGRLPIVCGGTGLYIRGLLNGIISEGESDATVREQLLQDEQKHGLAYLFEKLRSVDPASAELYGPNDKQRIVRALEVFTKTGLPLSSLHVQSANSPVYPGSRVYVLHRDRQVLYGRINDRVNQMFRNGLMDEVSNYVASGYGLDNPAINALGYRELIEALNGERTVESALEVMKQKSRNYAKRQLTWFRSMQNARWIECDNHSEREIAEEIRADWEKIDS